MARTFPVQVHRKMKHTGILELFVNVCLVLLNNPRITYSQNSLTCGPVCLLEELSCYCELAINDTSGLGWTLLDVNTSQVGLPVSFTKYHTVGSMETFANGQFIATLTNVTVVCATVATGTVSQTIDGYTLQCVNSSGVDIIGEEIISIPDKPSQPENLTAMAETSTGSVLLSWAPPINNSECVVSYIITSTLPNSTVSISTTLNYTLNPVDGVILTCTYSASVAANDTAGRMGNWSEVLFSFNGPSLIKADPPSQITQVSLSYLSNSTVKISWILPNELLLECTVINISTNASAQSSTTNSTSTIITKPAGDPEDAIYSVTLAAMDRAGRTGKQSEARCFSFKAPIIQSVHSNTDICASTIITMWTVELSECLPSVSKYFITVTNVISGVSNTFETNETTWVLNDVHFGDEYVIEIVPHSALGNGSANITTISIPDACPTTSTTFEDTSVPTDSCVVNCADCLVIGIAVLIAVMVEPGFQFDSLFHFLKKKRIHFKSDSKGFPLDCDEEVYTSQNAAYATVMKQDDVSKGIIADPNPAYSFAMQPEYEEVKK